MNEDFDTKKTKEEMLEFLQEEKERQKERKKDLDDSFDYLIEATKTAAQAERKKLITCGIVIGVNIMVVAANILNLIFIFLNQS